MSAIFNQKKVGQLSYYITIPNKFQKNCSAYDIFFLTFTKSQLNQQKLDNI